MLLAGVVAAGAQGLSGSSSAPQSPAGQPGSSSSAPAGSGARDDARGPGSKTTGKAAAKGGASSSKNARAMSPESLGSAVTLETNEQMFDMSVALNACGYDTDLADSDPVRVAVRRDLDEVIAGSPAAQASRRALCAYVDEHRLSGARDLAQYVSLALYLSPPPELETTAEQPDMPPDALQVVNMLPQLRAFAKDAGLIGLWQRHRKEYNTLSDKAHDPVTQMIAGTNIYLRLPASSYDGRRFVVVEEPMLAPDTPNARIYATDYVIEVSPSKTGDLRLDDIRHTYLHYEIEPLVYAKQSSMERLMPLLKPMQKAPVDFTYKTNLVALLTECLIKAIEARTMTLKEARPVLSKEFKGHMDAAYDQAVASYERRTTALRQQQVELDMQQGWILVDYFYDKVEQMEHDQIGLKEDIGEMVYGMDVGREQHHASQIAFLPEGSGELVTRAPRQPTGLMLAEKKMMEGDVAGAEAIATKALDDPKQDHAEAKYVLARVQLMEGQPEDSLATFEEVLASSKNPHTLAWAHIYIGRLYDTEPNRPKAMQEYRAALAVQEGQPIPQDAKMAAEKGLKAPFVLPKVEHVEEEPVDPSGKAEKEQYGKEHPAGPPPTA